ncbi:MAG: acyltransferase, partial [Erythrobacter sp.]|nr:acyltransferase [Erythrobacter sp.]
LALPPLVALGLASYAFYLWHWPALVLVRYLYLSAEPPVLATAIALLAALLLAVLSTRLVERPLRRRGAEAVLHRRGLFALSAAVVLTLVGWAQWSVAQEGFWQRAPGLRQAVEQASARPEIDATCRTSWREHGTACRFGAPGEVPQVLLWGDSHAASLLPGLDLLLQDRGVAGAATVTTGCPPIPGFRRAKHGDDLDCAATNAAVLRLFDLQPHAFGTVILSARWITHVTQANALGEAGLHDPLVDAATGEPVPLAAAPQVVEASLGSLVERITGSGRRVVIVGGIPEQGRDVPALFLASRFGALVPFVAPPVQDVRAREAPADAILHRLAQRPGVTLVDPVAVVCGRTCPNSADGHLLYRDGNHLSPYAAQLFVPAMFAGLAFPARP